MAEEFQGGVCGGMWWNPSKSLFSGGGATSLSSPCSVAQLGGGGGFDMGSFGWPNEVLTKGTKAINNIHSNFDNTLVFPCDLDSTLDWSQPNIFCNGGSNEANFGSIMLEDEINSSNIMNTNMNNFNNLDASPPMAATSGDSSTITSEGGLINSSFSMSSSASYLIQTLFDDTDESQLLQSQLPISQLPMNSQNYGCVINSSDLNWVKPSSPNLAPPLPSPQLGQKFDLDVGMNMLVNGGQDAMNGQYSTTTNLGNNIRASLINSLKSRSRAPTFNIQKSQNSVYLATKVNKEEDQPLAKRPRIETPSHMPTFKVRKEKLGDRITALQQLVSPFGKTDTASVLHEAIEYIKFLHDQVNALSTPYLKNGSPMQHQQEKEEDKQNLKRQGLCLVPISSTYPVVQETPVDFWTPTFGGPSFR